MKRILLSPPDVGATERRLLLDAFDSNWIAPVGPHIDAFEREFAEAIGVPHAVALSSGTAALHLGLIAAGVQRGDRVITSTPLRRNSRGSSRCPMPPRCRAVRPRSIWG